jgi:hydrogenase nickel incorporation protein HypA/HybF
VHEVSIVESLIVQVEQEVAASGHTGRVTRLDLVVGRLSGVYAGAIRFAFELLSPGTVVESAELRIAEPKARCRCDVCGACAEIDELVARCPECGNSHVAIDGGQELLLETIELEE